MYKGNATLKKEKPNKSLNKIILAITTVILTLVLLLSVISFSGLTSKEVYYKDIEIEDGQTLWQIAESEFGKNSDIRKYVYQIKKINNIESSNIVPGQIIKVPVEKEV